jgi:uncharacterized membrane protein
MRFREKVSRSFVKASTFRILILISDGIIVLLLTHKYDLALGFVVFTNLASMLIYFFHERIWNSIDWGKSK